MLESSRQASRSPLKGLTQTGAILMKFALRFLLLGLPFIVMLDISRAENLPEFRPALLGHGPRSLINKINVESLMKRGQRDAVIMFSCFVSSLGQGGYMRVYRCSPNSELLQNEAMGQCWRAHFEPAVYNHQTTEVMLTGTIVFFVANEKPHLRIFLNQENEDIKGAKDFVAPQLAFPPGNPKFEGFRFPPGAPGHEAVVAVSMDCNTMGKASNAKVDYEYPKGLGFGAQILDPIPDAVFVPGFRNGKPVACHFTMTLISFGARRGSRGMIKSS